jgi:hypothetical protein
MQSSPCLLDEHIREALKRILEEQDSTAAIIDEMPLLRGRGRADLAFVNGRLCGFEIKSEADSLIRLGSQAPNYEAVFEFNTVVAAHKHLRLAKERLPRTWGIVEAGLKDGKTILRWHRHATRNHNLSNAALVRILWKNECLSILRKRGVHVCSNAPIVAVWALLESMNTRQLCDGVREALKRRHAKSAVQQTLYGDSHTTVAIE